MELQQLRMFVQLLEAGTYVAAGEKLHVAHSAVHRQIRLLEQELGQRLVYRNGGVTLATEAGKDVAEVARRVLKDIGNLSHRIAEKSTLGSGHVHLGTGTTMLLYFLPDILSVFRKAYPMVDVQIMTGTAPEVLTAIRDSTLDLGIVFADPEEPSVEDGIRFEPLNREEFVLIVPPSHPFGRARSVVAADLQGLPLISLSRASTIRHMIESRLEKSGVAMHTVMELENEEAIEKMVGIGIGMGFISRRRADATGLRYVRLTDLNLHADLCVAYSTRIPIAPAGREFLTVCLKPARRQIVRETLK